MYVYVYWCVWVEALTFQWLGSEPYTYIHIQIRLHNQTNLKLIHSYTHTLIHSYTHTLIHSYTHILTHSYTHTLIHSYAHTLIHSEYIPDRTLSTVVSLNSYTEKRTKFANLILCISPVLLGMYVCKCFRMYVCMHVCMYVCMYVCLFMDR